MNIKTFATKIILLKGITSVMTRPAIITEIKLKFNTTQHRAASIHDSVKTGIIENLNQVGVKRSVKLG